MFIIVIIIAILIFMFIKKMKHIKLENKILKELGFSSWDIIPRIDKIVPVKSRQSLEKYDDIKFLKSDCDLSYVEKVLAYKNEISTVLRYYLQNNNHKSEWQYNRVEARIKEAIDNASAYRINVTYISSAGNNLGEKVVVITQQDANRFHRDPSLLMGKGEYNKYLKEQQKESLLKKQHHYYENINRIIDYSNKNKDTLVIKGAIEKLDGLIAQLFDRTVNSIKKIKTIDSEEWDIIGLFAAHLEGEINDIVIKNQKIIEYYESPDFLKIKETCEVLMSTQREFNEYIKEKIDSLSKLFGTRIVRNETINEDEYKYIRPYKKTITPFTAEVSATVFASAENNPLAYVIKHFYPNKKLYPEQIQKLHLLIEELETLKEAKQIIENHKKDYQQYLGNVPDFIMNEDEAGFYSRLGFANIDESVLNVEYKFSYTSGGGMAKRTFSIPMTEETIVELITALEENLTTGAFTKEQRALMTKKLREFIKSRDNFTCCNCGNSTYKEPNLLLEIDHIIPVSKGGCTVEENLQTLCWKCNRSKSNKIQET